MFQTLVAAWPIEADRVCEHVRKAAREAKTRTSWTDPDQRYEECLDTMARGLVEDADARSVIERFVERLEPEVDLHVLSHAAIRLTAVGVPDLYQGTELAALLLTDPDNRRAVDFQARAALLEKIKGLSASKALSLGVDVAKLWMIERTLRVREQHASAFDAEHRPLRATGPDAECIVAYLRGDRIAVVAPRLVHRFRERRIDARVELPPGAWRDAFSERTARGGWVEAHSMWTEFPIALLIRESSR